jgi:indolepyruvate ferredoxin oxidoreductase beta subunit
MGAVASHIKISKEISRSSPLIPKGEADIIVGIEPLEALRTLVTYGNPDVITITNPRPVHPIDVISGEADYPELDKVIETIAKLSAKSWIVNATDEALNLGKIVLSNTILLGSLIGLNILPLDEKSIRTVLKEQFPKTFSINMIALRKGLDLLC